MVNPFQALWAAVRDLFDEFFVLIVCNLLWTAISVPIFAFGLTTLLYGAPFIAAVTALIGVLPAAPATAGLTYVNFKVSDGRAVKIGDFFAGMRSHARPALLLGAAWVLGLLVIMFNLGFYLNVENMVGGVLLGLWLYVLIAWAAVLIYSFPLLFLQERPDLRVLARNAALMVLGRPVFTVATLVLMAIILGLCAFLVAPLFLMGAAFFNLWSMRATRALIDYEARRRAAAEAAGTSQSAPPAEERGRKGQVRPK